MLTLNKRMVKVLRGSKYLKGRDTVNHLIALKAERKLVEFLAILQAHPEDGWLIFYLENHIFFSILKIRLRKVLKQRRQWNLRELKLFKVYGSLKVIKRSVRLRMAVNSIAEAG